MPYIVTEPCTGVKDKSCMTVCPVDCIYEDDDMVYIHPDECIDCGLCEAECPVSAIFVDTDVPDNYKEYVELNRIKSEELAG
jgi:NAD-dependent dihydropyrimidine dehydrogenase PreA subunit